MCGRATLTSPVEDVAAIFDVSPIDIGPPRFNLAPSQPILTLRRARRTTPPHEDEAAHDPWRRDHELAVLRWGLIPFFTKPDDVKRTASRCIQARAETAARSPAFRESVRRHRCLVIVDGFFEWKTLPDGRRLPHHVRRREGRRPFAIAGVWAAWPAAADLPTLETCAVLTTRSAGAIRGLHDRMPLVLGDVDEWRRWVDGTEEDAARTLAPSDALLERRADELVVLPVSTWVNDVKHDDPGCLAPPRDDEPSSPRGRARSRPSTRKASSQMGFDFAAARKK